MKYYLKQALKRILPMIYYRVDRWDLKLTVRDYLIIGFFRKSTFYNSIPEKGVQYGIDLYVKPGMMALQIGGGAGITSLRTLSKLDNSGYLTIYEGGKESVTVIKKNIYLNGYKNFKIIQSIVGENINVFGGNISNSMIISAKDLPSCDYLELDCEGSEKGILESILNLPRYIVMEVHPKLIGHPINWLYKFIHENNYLVDYLMGHNGNRLAEEEFQILYNHNLTTGENSMRDIKGVAPMVIGLIHLNCIAK